MTCERATWAPTAKLSREHAVVVSPSGLVTITGGKWTTYRRMGADAVDRAIEVGGLPQRPSSTAALRLHGWQESDRRSRRSADGLRVGRDRNPRPGRRESRMGPAAAPRPAVSRGRGRLGRPSRGGPLGRGHPGARGLAPCSSTPGPASRPLRSSPRSWPRCSARTRPGRRRRSPASASWPKATSPPMVFRRVLSEHRGLAGPSGSVRTSTAHRFGIRFAISSPHWPAYPLPARMCNR